MATDTGAPRATMERGSVYRFGKGQSENQYLGRGWGEPEAGFVWSEGKYSTVLLPRHPTSATLGIGIWGYTPPGILAQEVLIFLNGLMRGYFPVSERITLRLALNDARDQYLEVAFYLPSATSPQIVEGSTDQRCLSIALATIQFSQ